jgi:hypothetical protein
MIMKITNDRIQGPGATRKAGKSSAGAAGFAGLIDGMPNAEESKETGGSQAAAGIDALLSVQEMPVGMADEKRGKRRGKDLLDQLDALRLSLIAGAIPRQRLASLVVALGKDSDTVTDPALAEVLQEIDLRARVELAKYDQRR